MCFQYYTSISTKEISIQGKDADSKYNLSCIMNMHAGKTIFRRRIGGLPAIKVVNPFGLHGTEGNKEAIRHQLSNLTGIADVDIVATLFTYDMLAKEGEEYWIVMSEICND
ncbi:hypothetical protein T10_10754 [Trichinella papuae]|uniref:Uncharacterized protein n=2 Tax=Trichinella papuae TaxID=268474 RepID=A0A0V1M101_9BILA|nr:hypothetical protein T10_10754 [Trichinella papuae]KRZ65419.1 hypothetical protein T10_10754 [Trichinella papuae]